MKVKAEDFGLKEDENEIEFEYKLFNYELDIGDSLYHNTTNYVNPTNWYINPTFPINSPIYIYTQTHDSYNMLYYQNVPSTWGTTTQNTHENQTFHYDGYNMYWRNNQ